MQWTTTASLFAVHFAHQSLHSTHTSIDHLTPHPRAITAMQAFAKHLSMISSSPDTAVSSHTHPVYLLQLRAKYMYILRHSTPVLVVPVRSWCCYLATTSISMHASSSWIKLNWHYIKPQLRNQFSENGARKISLKLLTVRLLPVNLTLSHSSGVVLTQCNWQAF